MNKIALTSLACLFAVSAVAQDYTSKIVNPSFENGTEGWTITNLVPQSNDDFKTNAGAQLKHGNRYMEKWVAKGGAAGDATAKQTVRKVPFGKYELTVSAQNRDQNNVTKACTGVTIYAKTTSNSATVTLPGDYTVSFESTSYLATVNIGFTAKGATGNWLALDNFRLKKVGDIETSKMISALNSKINNVKLKQTRVMSKDAKTALDDAIAKASAMTAENTPDEINEAFMGLFDAEDVVDASIADFSNTTSLLTTAKGYVGKVMQREIATKLNDAIAAGEALKSQESTDAEVKAAITALTDVINEADANNYAYLRLSSMINTLEAAYNPDYKGAEEYNKYLTQLKQDYEDRILTTPEAQYHTANIPKVILQFRLNNATPGPGTPVGVTFTNHYVPTGATEALMRADFVGENILEKGVCWSTEHNPTVMDERTMTFWTLNGNIYHITGLKSATVYYLRPYVMNKTYEVAYGDEVKIVTHQQGTCVGTWNEGAPTEEANARCRNAIKETIDYFNEWTGIAGFRLTGNYGAGTPTADCSYGGWMRIGPNAGNQAIGTVIHETGHGVGVGTSSRYADKNLHNWKWLGREANQIYSFLENKEANPYTSDFCMVGDGTHAWGASATYDWFVNGADKDKHQPLQYAGGCILLYGMFVDGLNPTTGYTNGLPAYTYNFDDRKTYYIMCKSDQCGLGTGVVGANVSETTGAVTLKWKNILGEAAFLTDNDAWELSFNAQTRYYQFRNVGTGCYLSHPTAMSLKETASPTATENFQLMPDRTDVTIGEGDKQFKTHGYWFTWNNGSLRAMRSSALSNGLGDVTAAAFDFADTATAQQYIIIAEDELVKYRLANGFTLGDVNLDGTVNLADAKLITDYFLGNKPANFAKELADMNGDGKVTEADANIIVNQTLK